MYSARDRKGQIVRLRDLDGQGPDKVTREGHVHENILFEFPDISNLIINT